MTNAKRSPFGADRRQTTGGLCPRPQSLLCRPGRRADRLRRTLWGRLVAMPPRNSAGSPIGQTADSAIAQHALAGWVQSTRAAGKLCFRAAHWQRITEAQGVRVTSLLSAS